MNNYLPFYKNRKNLQEELKDFRFSFRFLYFPVIIRKYIILNSMHSNSKSNSVNLVCRCYDEIVC